ncbi:monovalent cation/H+ antiporter complex subunit F [Streptomyces sp. NPDC003703]|uniref:monovalent cation/H+ antiporter complex subunit F n=1 Tax=Streptomyces sp. NPDC003283 TaxID=3364681 RepID=UPI00369D44A4
MNGWIAAATAVLAAGLGTALWGVATRPLSRRVVAQNLSTAVVCPALLLLAQGYGRTSYVDLALLLAVARPGLLAAPGWALPLRRLQSGHVGDYVAWLLVGSALLGAPALPGVLGR